MSFQSRRKPLASSQSQFLRHDALVGLVVSCAHRKLLNRTKIDDREKLECSQAVVTAE